MIKSYFHVSKLLQQYPFEEKESTIRIYRIKLNFSIFSDLVNINTALNTDQIGSLILSSDFPIDIDLENNYSSKYESLELNIRIDKIIDSKLFFLSEKGLNEYLKGLIPSKFTDKVYLPFLNNDFNSESVYFLSNFNKDYKIESKTPLNSLKYVRALNSESQSFLPFDILIWLTPEIQIKNAPNIWRTLAGQKLLYTLCSELFTSQNELELIFKGERKRSIIIELETQYDFTEFFNVINTCADWIYNQFRDVETRHSIFNNQISILLNQDKTRLHLLSQNIFKEALENSKLTYGFHLQNSSKELIKTLADINKTLFDYINRIRQNTVDLINNIWKDFTTMLVYIIVNVTFKKPELPSVFFKILGIGVIVYLAASLFLTARIGFWYYHHLKMNLISWKTKIYTYLSDDDFNVFASLPLGSAQLKYETTFYYTLILYIIMIIATMIFAFELILPNQIRMLIFILNHGI